MVIKMYKYKQYLKEELSYPEANKILKPFGFRVRKGKGYVYFDGIVPVADLTHDSLETFDLSGWNKEDLIDTLLSRIVDADFDDYKDSIYGQKYFKQLQANARKRNIKWSIYY